MARLIEIPDDGIIIIPIMRGEDTIGERRIDLSDLPTVDAEKVVRCRDCKWYRIAPTDNVPYCCHESGYCGEYMGGLFYCACGERRTDG